MVKKCGEIFILDKGPIQIFKKDPRVAEPEEKQIRIEIMAL
jgi:hypothetical protein